MFAYVTEQVLNIGVPIFLLRFRKLRHRKLIWMFWALLIGLMESAFMPSYLEHHYPEKVLVRESIEWILTARLLFLPVFFVPTLTPPRPR